jgi:hypothetical protein
MHRNICPHQLHGCSVSVEVYSEKLVPTLTDRDTHDEGVSYGVPNIVSHMISYIIFYNLLLKRIHRVSHFNLAGIGLKAFLFLLLSLSFAFSFCFFLLLFLYVAFSSCCFLFMLLSLSLSRCFLVVSRVVEGTNKSRINVTSHKCIQIDFHR